LKNVLEYQDKIENPLKEIPMRRFHSYGPVNARSHFSAPRTVLVDNFLNSLIGSDNEGGHYFTIWAPRQTGKTWLTRQAVQEVKARYPDQYEILSFSPGFFGASGRRCVTLETRIFNKQN
jgi:hypothetical protein